MVSSFRSAFAPTFFSRAPSVFGVLGVAGLFALSGLGSAPAHLTAQVAISASAGAASYDLSGVGTSGVAAVRAEWPLLSHLDLQAGTGFFWYETQFDRQIVMLLPEVGLQLRTFERLPLLVGVGAGHTLGVKGGVEDDFTLYGSLGLDIAVQDSWAIRPEGRVRALDPWVGTIAELTVGVRRVLD